ncbi:MAG: methyltransferase [Odoribacter sp.]|nr:methyltransferase [Odoribacter sp.]
MIHHKVCPLCSSPEISHFLSCTDHFVSKEVFNICWCGRCGFIFTQDAPDESEAGRYYESDDYISHSDSKKGITDKAYQFIRRIMLHRKKKLIRKITGLSSGTILDIGSGTGHFLNIMKVSGWDIKGVEISGKARENAVRIFNIDTIPPEKIQDLPSNSFDCITLWHVLEHFREPFKFMEEIGRLLKPGGVVFIALPNSGSFDSKHYGKKWAAYDVPRHLWHFNPKTFSIFALKNNYSIIEKRYLPFDVFYISIISERYKGSRFALFSGTINGLRFSSRSIFKKSGKSSVIYILRKS